MATGFDQSISARAPFLLSGRSETSFNADFADAVKAAIIAEARATRTRAPERCRIATFLCELAAQLERMRPGYDRSAPMAVSRGDLAGMLGISLVRVKRVMGLLTLSGVAATDGKSVRVLDWRRLCGIARFDSKRFGMDPAEPAEVRADEEEETNATALTAAGDPACFV